MSKNKIKSKRKLSSEQKVGKGFRNILEYLNVKTIDFLKNLCYYINIQNNKD